MAPARTVAVLLLLGCVPVVGWAQGDSSSPPRPSLPGPSPQRNCQLSGRVIYAEEFKAAERILVRILWNSVPADQIFTDSLGRFESHTLGPNVYEIEIIVEGFKPIRQQVDLSMFCRTDVPPIMLEREINLTARPAGTMVSAAELRVPGAARKAFEKGLQELHEKKHPDRSVEHFREAIRIYPDYDLAYMQLGLAYAQQNELAEAEENLERCTELNQKNSRAFVLLGLVRGRQGQVSAALRALREAVRVDKNDWLGHFELARALGRAGLLDDAYKHAQRAHLLKPESPGVHLLLHDVSIRRHDYQTALAEAREFLEMFPDDPQATQMKQQEQALLQSGLVK